MICGGNIKGHGPWFPDSLQVFSQITITFLNISADRNQDLDDIQQRLGSIGIYMTRLVTAVTRAYARYGTFAKSEVPPLMLPTLFIIWD